MAVYERNTIIFALVYKNEEHMVQTSTNQYLSLMGLISDYLSIPGFGLCCGMGSCGTCLIEIDGVNTLSCAIAITDELANSRITISESRY